MLQGLEASLKRLVRRLRSQAKTLPQAKEVTFSVPGWMSVTIQPNEIEQRAAWSLYVEISTRVASQPFDQDTGRMRAVLGSLYTVFETTRQILRDAGPHVAHGPNSFGPVAIQFLTQVLAPFTTRWNEPLSVHEQSRPAERSPLQHERLWERFDEMLNDLHALQAKVAAYRLALAVLSGAD